MDLQRLAVVALSLADLAVDVDIGQELHLDLEGAVALAVLAAAALHVEAEAARAVAANPRLWDAGEELGDRAEEAGVGRRVGARRPADRALVDLDDLVDVVRALDRSWAPGTPGPRSARGPGPGRGLRDEGALAASPRRPLPPRRRPSGKATSIPGGCARGRRTRRSPPRSRPGGRPGPDRELARRKAPVMERGSARIASSCPRR